MINGRKLYLVSNIKCCEPAIACLDYNVALMEASTRALAGDDPDDLITTIQLNELHAMLDGDANLVITSLSELERCARSTIL